MRCVRYESCITAGERADYQLCRVHIRRDDWAERPKAVEALGPRPLSEARVGFQQLHSGDVVHASVAEDVARRLGTRAPRRLRRIRSRSSAPARTSASARHVLPSFIHMRSGFSTSRAASAATARSSRSPPDDDHVAFYPVQQRHFRQLAPAREAELLEQRQAGQVVAEDESQ